MNVANNAAGLIIISSDEPWNNVWHTQLHYAYQLSKRCTVYYIGPPQKWKFSNLFSWKLTVKQEKENLFVLKYLNVFPLSFMNTFFVTVNDLINSFLLKRKIADKKNQVIFWKFTYYRFLRNWFIKPVHTVYHVVDHYMEEEHDKRLASRSDLVILTSPKFMDYYRMLNKNVINVPQAVSSEEFICDESIVSKLREEYGKIILFIGTLSWETNLNIPEKISEEFPEHTLLIIGPNKIADEKEKEQFKNICARKNVTYFGIVPGNELKNYVKASEVCIIPYKFSHEKKMNNRSPLKAISYLAQNKIVITTIDCEIKELENKSIFKAENLEEFMSLMKKAVNKSLVPDEKATEAFLKRINYDTLIDFIFSRMERKP
jgi:hypothetical protein